MSPALKRRRIWLLVLAPFILLLIAVPGGSLYYSAAGGKACIRCHEVQGAYDRWAMSTHRSVACKECHDSIYTTDLSVHWNNARQLWRHLRKETPERLLVKQSDINRGMNDRCGKCHQQEYASWVAGPHHANFGDVFLNQGHNTNRVLSDHCLQCHGMFFERGIRDLVQPINRQGPWRLATETVAATDTTIPCLACHSVHRPGEPMGTHPTNSIAANAPAHRPSLGFYDRREQLHFGADLLPLPEILEVTRRVKMSPDPRQSTCYQCHAPDHTFQAGSGDDRTCLGVHEGLSCMACHQGHDQNTRASCAQCHPRLSNCGLNVESMDTTFKSATSTHNIHFVKCADCHPGRKSRKLVTE
jgi:hypothetical protein